MAGQGLRGPALTLIWGNPCSGSFLRAPGCRAGPLHPRAGSWAVWLQGPPCPAAALSWAGGHELQEQDTEEKIFCCVNTALSFEVDEFQQRARAVAAGAFQSWAEFSQTRRLSRQSDTCFSTHGKETEGCPSDTAASVCLACKAGSPHQSRPTRPPEFPGPPAAFAVVTTMSRF